MNDNDTVTVGELRRILTICADYVEEEAKLCGDRPENERLDRNARQFFIGIMSHLAGKVGYTFIDDIYRRLEFTHMTWHSLEQLADKARDSAEEEPPCSST